MRISELVEEYNNFKQLTVTIKFNDFQDNSFIEVGMLFPIVSITKKNPRSYVIQLDPSRYRSHNLTLCRNSAKFQCTGFLEYCFMESDNCLDILPIEGDNNG